MSTVLTRIIIQSLDDNRGDQGGIEVSQTLYEQTFDHREVDIRAVIRAANTEPERTRQAVTATEVAALSRGSGLSRVRLNLEELDTIIRGGGISNSDWERMRSLVAQSRDILSVL